MYAPAVHDESATFVGYLDQQLAAVRAAAYGLTEAQVRERPCRSALSVGGIVTHVTHGMRGAVRMLTSDELPELDEAAFGAYLASFALGDDDTAEGVLAEFDAARAEYLAVVGAADPDAERLAPAAPWQGLPEAAPIRTRYYLWHQVEEMARHAGHADILREQLDGVSVPTLVMTREGMPANDFFQPYRPAPGTVVA